MFLFNPFDDVALSKFIANNLIHFTAYQSVIAYANDIHRIELSKAGFDTLFRDQIRRMSIFERGKGRK